MDALPLDVLCLVLELCETEAWLVRLRGLSRRFRRAVDRVAARVLPLPLLVEGSRAWERRTPVACALALECRLHELGCGAFLMGSHLLRLRGATLEVAGETGLVLLCGGHGFALLRGAKPGSDGELVCLLDEAIWLRVVPWSVMATALALQNPRVGADGAVWGCNEVLFEIRAQRLDLATGALETRGRAVVGESVDAAHVVQERFLDTCRRPRTWPGQPLPTALFCRVDLCSGRATSIEGEGLNVLDCAAVMGL